MPLFRHLFLFAASACSSASETTSASSRPPVNVDRYEQDCHVDSDCVVVRTSCCDSYSSINVKDQARFYEDSALDCSMVRCPARRNEAKCESEKCEVRELIAQSSPDAGANVDASSDSSADARAE